MTSLLIHSFLPLHDLTPNTQLTYYLWFDLKLTLICVNEKYLYNLWLPSFRTFTTVRSVDSDEAIKVEGVHAYISAQDVPGKNSLGVIVQDEELFATTEVWVTYQV